MSSTQPNILLITFDQMGQNILDWARAHGVPKTPNIDRLSAGGLGFSQCTSPSPVCGPTRASIMTGLYPSRHGVWTNDIPPNPHLQTIAQRLADAGYTTCSIGKMHFTPTLDPWGFTHQQRTEDVHRMRNRPQQDAYLRWLKSKGMEYRAFDQAHSVHAPGGEYRSGRSGLPAELHQDHWVADRSIDFLTARDGTPFFLWTSFIGPHDPINPPAPFDEMYRPEDLPEPLPALQDRGEVGRLHHQHCWGTGPAGGTMDLAAQRRLRAHYAGAVTFLDQQVGRLLDTLEEQGLADSTFVVFTTDHGEMLFDQGLREKGPWPYEQSLRIPLLVRGPGVRAGQTTDQLVSLVDLAPTFCRWAIGEAFSRDQQGMSLDGICLAEPAEPIRQHTISEFGDACKIVRDRRYSYACYPGRGEAELYDRQTDPQQQRNLAGLEEYAAIERDRLMQIVEFQAQSRASFSYEAKDITPALVRGIRQHRPHFAPQPAELHHPPPGMTEQDILTLFSPGE